VGPLLLFALLRLLKISSIVAAFTTALYVANPGVLSLEALHFRSAKAVANVAILFCLWLAGIQNALLQKGTATDRQMTWRFGVLCLITFVCLFSDEVALIVYPAIAILFPRIVFRTRLTTIIFALIPIAYV